MSRNNCSSGNNWTNIVDGENRNNDDIDNSMHSNSSNSNSSSSNGCCNNYYTLDDTLHNIERNTNTTDKNNIRRRLSSLLIRFIRSDFKLPNYHCHYHCHWLKQYWTEMLWPGLGLFGESYLLFSIGTMTPLWKVLYPNCYTNNNTTTNYDYAYEYVNDEYDCPLRLVQSITYSVVIGVIMGMIVVGYLSNKIGRRNGSILTATFMSFGSCGLLYLSFHSSTTTASTITTTTTTIDITDMFVVRNMFRGLVAFFFLFGIGVGGEYPLSASLASEKAIEELASTEQQIIQQQQQQQQQKQTMKDVRRSRVLMNDSTNPVAVRNTNVDTNSSSCSCSNHHSKHNTPLVISEERTNECSSNSSHPPLDQHHQDTSRRGRRVQLVFANQGFGIWFNNGTMLILLLIFTSNRNNGDSDEDDANNNADNNSYSYTNIYYKYYQNNNDSSDNDGREEAYKQQLLMVWRITYGIGAFILFFVLVSRIMYLQESKVWLDSITNRTTTTNTEIANTIEKSTTNSSQSQIINNNNDNDNSVDTETTTVNSSRNRNCNNSEHTNKNNLKLLHQHYGVRLFGAGMAWLLWDISFYGNKLFQSTFLLALVGSNASILQLTSASFLNSTVALMGYYGAAYIIELPWYFGQRSCTKLQSIGFLLTGVLFLFCGMMLSSTSSTSTSNQPYSDSDSSPSTTTTSSYIMVSMYLLSSFIGQLGPNCTTFLIPTEIFPTEYRTYCHGICAAAGKVGALIAAILFHFVSLDNNNNEDEHQHQQQDQLLFFICAYTSFFACLITIVFIPETNNLNLLELDIQWNSIVVTKQHEQQQQQYKEGQGGQQQCQLQRNNSYNNYHYNGPANHPDHLSLYEQWRIKKQ